MDLYEKKLDGKDRHFGLKFADYEALTKKAKSLPKTDLENYYIDRKNDRDLNGWEIFFVILFIGFLLFLIIFATGITVVSNSVINIKSVEKDLCQYLPDNYISDDLLTGLFVNEYYTGYVNIDCSNLN